VVQHDLVDFNAMPDAAIPTLASVQKEMAQLRFAKSARNEETNYRDADFQSGENSIRLLLEDITLVRGDEITLHIRFKGGAAKTLTLPPPPNACQQRTTSPDVVQRSAAFSINTRIRKLPPY
jgi:hypothetical protein